MVGPPFDPHHLCVTLQHPNPAFQQDAVLPQHLLEAAVGLDVVRDHGLAPVDGPARPVSHRAALAGLDEQRPRRRPRRVGGLDDQVAGVGVDDAQLARPRAALSVDRDRERARVAS